MNRHPRAAWMSAPSPPHENRHPRATCMSPRQLSKSNPWEHRHPRQLVWCVHRHRRAGCISSRECTVPLAHVRGRTVTPAPPRCTVIPAPPAFHPVSTVTPSPPCVVWRCTVTNRTCTVTHPPSTYLHRHRRASLCGVCDLRFGLGRLRVRNQS